MLPSHNTNVLPSESSLQAAGHLRVYTNANVTSQACHGHGQMTRRGTEHLAEAPGQEAWFGAV